MKFVLLNIISFFLSRICIGVTFTTVYILEVEGGISTHSNRISYSSQVELSLRNINFKNSFYMMNDQSGVWVLSNTVTPGLGTLGSIVLD